MDNNIKDDFESLITTYKNVLERLVYYKLSNKADAEDILQDIYLTSYEKFSSLSDKAKFKSWIIKIAQNKINDYYRNLSKVVYLPINENIKYEPYFTRMGLTVSDTVNETMESLTEKEQQILHYYYIKDTPQSAISKKLNIPVGTVKSRLSNARKHFKEIYPYSSLMKGAKAMSKLPEIIPEIEITKIDIPAFPVVWKEMMGWFIVPKIGEKLTWAIYDYPERTKREVFDIKVSGKALVHGIEGVEIISKEFNTNCSEHKNTENQRTFVAQLTDTHSRILLESHYINGIKHTYTFYDEEFMKNWGFGQDNCGNEINIRPKGIITKQDNIVSANDFNTIDVAGRYKLKIGNRIFDTILVIDIECYDSGVISESYLDNKGRTILWRRFNKDDWAFHRYNRLWSDKLPNNDYIIVNGEKYVHWYSCITDYIFNE